MFRDSQMQGTERVTRDFGMIYTLTGLLFTDEKIWEPKI